MDGSAYGMGAVLLQEGELNPRTQKPMLCPITYYSNTFTLAEWNCRTRLGMAVPVTTF